MRIQSQSPKRNNSRARSGDKRQHYAQVRQMFNLPRSNENDNNRKVEECIKIMDTMQKQISKYEDKGRKENKQNDKYNELLIKYNTLLYKANTNDG